MSDEEIVRRVRAGEVDLFEILMRRYDQRVYRVARAALADDAEAEDVTQEAWMRAFQHLDQFAESARFSTAETAESLEVTEETVKTRLHRARALLRRELMARAGPNVARTFPVRGLALRPHGTNGHGAHLSSLRSPSRHSAGPLSRHA